MTAPHSWPVAAAIESVSEFLEDKAEIVASCYIAKCTIDVLRQSDDLEELNRLLIVAANERGGNDNVTVVLARAIPAQE